MTGEEQEILMVATESVYQASRPPDIGGYSLDPDLIQELEFMMKPGFFFCGSRTFSINANTVVHNIRACKMEYAIEESEDETATVYLIDLHYKDVWYDPDRISFREALDALMVSVREDWPEYDEAWW